MFNIYFFACFVLFCFCFFLFERERAGIGKYVDGINPYHNKWFNIEIHSLYSTGTICSIVLWVLAAALIIYIQKVAEVKRNIDNLNHFPVLLSLKHMFARNFSWKIKFCVWKRYFWIRKMLSYQCMIQYVSTMYQSTWNIAKKGYYLIWKVFEKYKRIKTSLHSVSH